MDRVFGTTGNNVCQERNVIGSFIEVLPPGLVVTRLAGDSRDVEQQVGRSGDGHIHLDGVADRLRGDNLSGSHAFFHQADDTASRLIGDQIELTGGGGHRRVARKRHAQGFGHHAHGIGGGHGSTASAGSPGMLHQIVVFVRVYAPGFHRAHFVLRVDVNHFLAATDPVRHVAARDQNGRDIQTRSRHEVTRNHRIAGGQQHHPVEEVAFHRDFHLVCDGVTAGNLYVLRVLQHHSVADAGCHHLQGKTACVADARLHTLGQLLQMHVTGVVFIPGIDHRNPRPALFLGGITHSAHQSPAAFARLAEAPLTLEFHLIPDKSGSSWTRWIRRRTVRRPRKSPGPR